MERDPKKVSEALKAVHSEIQSLERDELDRVLDTTRREKLFRLREEYQRWKDPENQNTF